MQATRSQAVLQVTEGLPLHFGVARSRAVQGDVSAAIEINTLDFEPSMHGYFDDIMSRFLSWDKDKTAQEVQRRRSGASKHLHHVASFLNRKALCFLSHALSAR
jgi:hypothetical protein